VKVLAAGGSIMSKRFWDTGVPKATKERRYTRTKGTGLGIRSREHIVVSGV